ncbi:hypothetical protein GF325_04655, partial [Candidatus Bathyarchaeota archaeon]|nr:hypothetical protein [Candidatus Bathyarchaeota archaeon]
MEKVHGGFPRSTQMENPPSWSIRTRGQVFSWTFQHGLPKSSTSSQQVNDTMVFSKNSMYTYTWRLLVRDLGAIMRNLPTIMRMNRGDMMDRAAIERIMIAVTGVNGCKHCSWMHSKLALKQGIPMKEIHQLLTARVGRHSKQDDTAILFAQHYAATQGNPDKEATINLLKTYGSEKARLITSAIYLITVGNYAGNTMEAFKRKLEGRTFGNGKHLLEFIFFCVGS